MREGTGIRALVVLLGAMLALGVAAPAALSAEIDNSTIIASQHNPPQSDDGWQAGTCTLDTPPCSVDTPAQFFEQAAGHPPVGFTQFIIKQEPGPVIGEIPVGNLKTVRVDLPEGLTVNPQATIAQCELDPGESPIDLPREHPGRYQRRHRDQPDDQSLGADPAGARLQHRAESRRTGAASASASRATTSTSRPRSPGRATTTSTSRSTSPNSN